MTLGSALLDPETLVLPVLSVDSSFFSFGLELDKQSGFLKMQDSCVYHRPVSVRCFQGKKGTFFLKPQLALSKTIPCSEILVSFSFGAIRALEPGSGCKTLVVFVVMGTL